MSLPPPYIPLGANAAAALAGGGEGAMVRVDVTRMPAQLMTRLAEAVRPVLVVGAIAERNRDGTVRLRTQSGDLTLRLPVEMKPGRTISVQLPPSPGLTAGQLARQALQATALLPRDALPQGLKADALEAAGPRPAGTPAVQPAAAAAGNATGRLPLLQPGTVQAGAPSANAPANAVAVRLLQVPAPLLAGGAATDAGGADGGLTLRATVAGTGADGTARLLTGRGEVQLRAPVPLRTGAVVSLQLFRIAAAAGGAGPGGSEPAASGGGLRALLLLPQASGAGSESRSLSGTGPSGPSGPSTPSTASALMARSGTAESLVRQGGQPAGRDGGMPPRGGPAMRLEPGVAAERPVAPSRAPLPGNPFQSLQAVRLPLAAAAAAYRGALAAGLSTAGAPGNGHGPLAPARPQPAASPGAASPGMTAARLLPASLLAPRQDPQAALRAIPATIRPVAVGPEASQLPASRGAEATSRAQSAAPSLGAAPDRTAPARGETTATRNPAPQAEPSAARLATASLRADRPAAAPPALGRSSLPPAPAGERSLSPLLQAQSDRSGPMAGRSPGQAGGKPPGALPGFRFASPFWAGSEPPEAGRSDPLPSLRQTLTALAQAQPGLAEQVVRSLIPQPNAALPATLLLFLSALRGGDIRAWLGDRVDRALEGAGRSDLARGLAAEFGALSRQTAESQQQPQDWRSLQVPLYYEGEVNAIRLSMRREQGGGPEEGVEDGEGSRFLIDLSLSRLGPLQLDGTLRATSLALTVRSHRVLPLALRQELGAVLDSACGAIGLAAGLSFQAGSTHFRQACRPD
ncbi:MAG: hypothetical protein GVY13_17935 [Alphaproteobacteria bacterium]|jgi:hypothetical protein|nr:hypothetical protein [Alphaproteobacteria bacterium]